MSPLGCLFGFVMTILAFLLIIVSGIARMARNIISKVSPQRDTEEASRTRQTHTKKEQSSASHASKNHKKVFDDNEGEYVDFEEIK